MTQSVAVKKRWIITRAEEIDDTSYVEVDTDKPIIVQEHDIVLRKVDFINMKIVSTKKVWRFETKIYSPGIETPFAETILYPWTSLRSLMYANSFMFMWCGHSDFFKQKMTYTGLMAAVEELPWPSLVVGRSNSRYRYPEIVIIK